MVLICVLSAFSQHCEIHSIAYCRICSFALLWSFPLHEYARMYPFYSCWTFGLFPVLGFHVSCCYQHSCTCVLVLTWMCLRWTFTQERNCWVRRTEITLVFNRSIGNGSTDIKGLKRQQRNRCDNSDLTVGSRSCLQGRSPLGLRRSPVKGVRPSAGSSKSMYTFGVISFYECYLFCHV